MSPADRIQALRAALEERILVLDGAMGTAIQALRPDRRRLRRAELEGCNEHLVLTRPDVIEQIHRGYLDAGADIIETDTFGGTRIVLAEYGLQDKVYEINLAAAQLAREAADAASTAERPRFVAGSMGPGTKTISVTGGVTFDEVRAAYTEQTVGLDRGRRRRPVPRDPAGHAQRQGGAARHRRRLRAARPQRSDRCCRCRSRPWARCSPGKPIESLYVSMAHRDLFAIGLNCATGPDFMTDHLRTLAEISRFPISLLPERRPAGRGGPLQRDAARCWRRRSSASAPRAGSTSSAAAAARPPEHIRMLAEVAARYQPRRRGHRCAARVVSGIETLVIDRRHPPGDRRRAHQRARQPQVQAADRRRRDRGGGGGRPRAGAHAARTSSTSACRIPTATRSADVTAFLETLVKKVKVPIMIDSTDAAVHRGGAASARRASRSSTRSTSRTARSASSASCRWRAASARRWSSAASTRTSSRRRRSRASASSQIAQRSHRAAHRRSTASPPEDIIFDALVFPVGTGDENYIGSGVETIEGIRLIKQALPECKTILGVSNVSFGLPPAGREVLNSVFLYHCVQAGLDMAIVNSEKLERYAVDPRGGAAPRRGSDLVARRRSDRRLRRALPRQGAEEDGRAAARPAARRAAGALHPRRLEGRAVRRPRRSAARRASRSRSSTAR